MRNLIKMAILFRIQKTRFLIMKERDEDLKPKNLPEHALHLK